MGYAANHAGKVFGRLTAVSRGPNANDGKPMWLCRCECGAEKLVRAASLMGGISRSCGCLQIELTVSRSVTHGLTYSPEWSAWRRMKIRCSDKRPGHREYYMDRGIVVCDRWANSFDTFLADMGPMPPGKRTLDRIDNDKGYEPNNCRWASTTEQNRNKRSNVYVTIDGRRMTATEAAREYGMDPMVVLGRLSNGWTVADAITIPKMRQGKRKAA